MAYEIRTADLWPDADFEMRAAPDGFTFEGYAAVYGLPSVRMSFPGVMGGRPFREVIQAGAFTKTLSEIPDVTLRYQHNMTALPLGRTKAGTMTLSEDERGLKVTATLPDNEWGRPIRDAIVRRDISGMSFRFKAIRESDPGTDADGTPVRNLREVKLGPEVSVTDFPAYPDTVATVRALAEEAEVDPDALIAALTGLKPEAVLPPEQREALIAVINKHSDAPVIDMAGAEKLALMQSRLKELRG